MAAFASGRCFPINAAGAWNGRGQRESTHTLSAAGSAIPSRGEFDAALGDAIAACEPELIVLSGFMRILGAAFVARFEGRIINLHPSLLPRYRGLDTHRRVLEAGDAVHGATVHFVTEALDAGPGIIQCGIPVQRRPMTSTVWRRAFTRLNT